MIVPFQGLEREEFRQILTRVRHSVLAQQEALFALDGVDLVFTDDAIDAIISQAVEMKSGRAPCAAWWSVPWPRPLRAAARGRGRVRCTISASR